MCTTADRLAVRRRAKWAREVKGISIESVKYEVTVLKVKTPVGSILQSLLPTKSQRDQASQDTHTHGFKTIALGDVHLKTALACTARGQWPQSESHGDGTQAFRDDSQTLGKSSLSGNLGKMCHHGQTARQSLDLHLTPILSTHIHAPDGAQQHHN